MGAVIRDEYSELPISRQRKYYLRKRKQGQCTKCGKPAADGSLCTEHLVQMREYRREKFGLKRRYYKSLSYQLTSKAHWDGGAASPPKTAVTNHTPHGDMIPVDSKIREVKERVDRVLEGLSSSLESAPSGQGQFGASKLLKSWVLMNLFSIPSPRLFCDGFQYRPQAVTSIGMERDFGPFVLGAYGLVDGGEYLAVVVFFRCQGGEQVSSEIAGGLSGCLSVEILALDLEFQGVLQGGESILLSGHVLPS